MRCPICDVLLEGTEIHDDVCRPCGDAVKEAVSYYEVDNDDHLLVEENDGATV